MTEAIRRELPKIPLGFVCRHFAVSRSGFYRWMSSKKSVRFVKKERVCEAISEIFKASSGTYGSPRVWHELKASGICASENTVARYMAEMGLDARLKKKFRVQTTDSKHRSPIAQRLIKLEDECTLPRAPGEVLAGDITYIRVQDRFLYLAVVMDLFTREVVGWSIHERLHTQLVLDALAAAMTKVGPDAEVIFHSDRGSQYASEAYRKFCKRKKVGLSMSRRGNCYDNAYVESWFASFKKECLYRQRPTTERELRELAFDYIEVWYNRRRRHSAIDNLSPVQYRESHHAAQ